MRRWVYGQAFWCQVAATLVWTVVSCLAGQAHGSDVRHLVLEGDVTFEDLGHYVRLPFDVPQGTTSIAVSYTYRWDAAGGAEARGLLDPVVDIGIYDPEKFRGWSGSDKSSFVVAATKEATTDSYVPGRILPGRWHVELGVASIRRDMVIHYSVDIELRDDPLGPPFVPPPPQDVVISRQARWYVGDLHCHSTHSDGQYPMEEVFDYARAIGLDFIALTDHNSFSHMLYLGEMQADYPDLLLLRGIELTTYRGHANVFDLYRPVDYHGTEKGYDINAVMEGIHEDGGFISANHPAHPFARVGEGYIGLGWAYPETRWDLMDFFEVVNGPGVVLGGIPNVLNSMAILLWEGLLSAGFKITAIGGSDDHKAGHGSQQTDPLYSPIGMPATLVYAEELSPSGILEGLKAGHAYVVAEGPDGPRIDFTARSGVRTAMVGDTIRGRDIEFIVEIIGGAGRTLTFWKDGIPWVGHYAVAVDRDPFTYTCRLRPLGPGRLRLELHNGPSLSALTNPIYFAPEPPFWGPDVGAASTVPEEARTASRRTGELVVFLPAFGLIAGLKRRGCKRTSGARWVGRRRVLPLFRSGATGAGSGGIGRQRGPISQVILLPFSEGASKSTKPPSTTGRS
jgi:hypothetical protein